MHTQTEVNCMYYDITMAILKRVKSNRWPIDADYYYDCKHSPGGTCARTRIVIHSFALRHFYFTIFSTDFFLTLIGMFVIIPRSIFSRSFFASHSIGFLVAVAVIVIILAATAVVAIFIFAIPFRCCSSLSVQVFFGIFRGKRNFIFLTVCIRIAFHLVLLYIFDDFCVFAI